MGRSGCRRRASPAQKDLLTFCTQDPAKIINLCREDMVMLWNDSTIQAVLDYQKLRLQDLPGLCVVPFQLLIIL